MPGAASFSSVSRISTPATWKVGPSTDACSEAGTCTDGKLLGCRAFDSAFQSWADSYGLDRPADDIGTCLDRNGHGSHTAATAGGNPGSPAIMAGADVSYAGGGMSGMAPGAAISAYKVRG